MDALSRDNPVWPVSGAQNWLLQSSDRLIKLPRWTIFSAVPREALEARYRDELMRLRIYGPELCAEPVYYDHTGSRVAADAPWTICGLLLLRGEPFLEERWQKSSHSQQLYWAQQLAEALTAAHRRAPPQAPDAGGRGAATRAAVASLLESIGQERHRLGLNRDWPELRAPRLDAVPETDLRPEPLLHGDLHLANVVMVGPHLQFIDPGESLFRISGLSSNACSANWDRAALAFSLRKRGSADAARTFLRLACADGAFDPADYARFSACFFLTLCCLSLTAMAPGATTPEDVGASAPLNELRAHAGYARSLFQAAARLLSAAPSQLAPHC